MRTLYFCSGCAVLLSQEEIEEDTDCLNCGVRVDQKIGGQFTDEDASKLETAATDQTQ